MPSVKLTQSSFAVISETSTREPVFRSSQPAGVRLRDPWNRRSGAYIGWFGPLPFFRVSSYTPLVVRPEPQSPVQSELQLWNWLLSDSAKAILYDW
jgi:hypothetical protein